LLGGYAEHYITRAAGAAVLAKTLKLLTPRRGACRNEMSKRFQMVGFKGSSQEKSSSEIFRFGYGKAVNDKMVPDPVGSEVL